ncbi:hypothetical protein [Streptomyces sp. NPDC050264]
MLTGPDGELDLHTGESVAAEAHIPRAHPGFQDRLDPTFAPAA